MRDLEDAVGAARRSAVEIAVRTDHERSERVMPLVKGERVHRLRAAVEVHPKHGSAGVVFQARVDRSGDCRPPEIARLRLDESAGRAESTVRVEVMDDGEVPVRVDPEYRAASRRASDEVSVRERRAIEVPVAGQEEISKRVLAGVSSGELVNRRDVAVTLQAKDRPAAGRASRVIAPPRPKLRRSCRPAPA